MILIGAPPAHPRRHTGDCRVTAGRNVLLWITHAAKAAMSVDVLRELDVLRLTSLNGTVREHPNPHTDREIFNSGQGHFEGGGAGRSPEMLLLSCSLAASIHFSPPTKIHQAAVLAHGLCFSMVAGRGINKFKDPHGNNLQWRVQPLCHSGVPRGSTGAQTVVRSSPDWGRGGRGSF